MTDIVSTESIQTPSAPLPATATAGLRFAAAILLPLAVQRGWIDAGTTVDAVLGIAVPAAAVLYGLYKTHDRQKRLTAVTHGLVGLLEYISHHAPQNAAAEE